MSRKLLLVDHPSLGEVAEQIRTPVGFEGRYGDYTGKRPDVILDETTRNIGEAGIELISIAPGKMERLHEELGGLMIEGVTREGESARVEIPLNDELDTLGTIFLSEDPPIN